MNGFFKIEGFSKALETAQRAGLKGKFQIEHRNDAGELIDTYDVPNGIVDEGLNHILNTQFHQGTQVATWYIGLVDNSGWTAFKRLPPILAGRSSRLIQRLTELSGMKMPHRRVRSATVIRPTSRSIPRATSKASSFPVTTSRVPGTPEPCGVRLRSRQSSRLPMLWSTAAFSAIVSVANGDTLKITYTVSG